MPTKYLKNNTDKNIEGVEITDDDGTKYKMDIPLGEVLKFTSPGLFNNVKDTINKKVIECDQNGNPI